MDNSQLSKYNLAMNNLVKSINNMKTLSETLKNKKYFNQIKSIDDISAKVDSCLTKLDNTKSKLNSIIENIKQDEAKDKTE